MACIYYQPDAYSTRGPKLMGRNAAGESFLKGFLRYAHNDQFWIQVQDVKHAEHFAEQARSVSRHEPIHVVDKNRIAALSNCGVAYYPGPGIGEFAWQRALHGHGGWSLCGITHTTSSARAMDALSDLITAPVQPWDAVICTSTAVKDNVQRILQAQVDYLKDRLGVSRLLLPQLPVIPLGIHSKDFVYTEAQKSAARAHLNVDESTLVVLFMGRLSFHAKAHPLAMYQALEQAAKRTGKQVLLLECGWHANEFISKAYSEAASQACPSVRVVTMDGRSADDRNTAWAAADVFCSLSDNIQETFGIVPIEAMAAGLPVVVSDWDGYKDTVRDGVDGFRAPTIMPAAGLGGDLALHHALEIDTYDMYCGHTCSLIGVDIEATSNAFTALFESAALRARMGEAGRRRAIEVYDWSVIIPQYEALWTELNHIRRTESKVETLKYPWPARMDPFAAFAAYPSMMLSPQTRICRVDSDFKVSLQRVEASRNLAMVNFAKNVLPSSEEVAAVLTTASSMPTPAIDLVQGISPERQAFVFRSLAWLIKLGVLRVCT